MKLKKVNNKDYLNYFRDYITIEEKYRKTLGNIVYKENLSECLKYINHKEQNDLNLINKFIDEVFFKMKIIVFIFSIFFIFPNIAHAI